MLSMIDSEASALATRRPVGIRTAALSARMWLHGTVLLVALLHGQGCGPGVGDQGSGTFQVEPGKATSFVAPGEAARAQVISLDRCDSLARQHDADKVARSGDSITLELPTPHGPYFVVHAPSREKRYFVVYPKYPGSDRVGWAPPPPGSLDPTGFETVSTLTFSVDALRGLPFGPGEWELVFQDSGLYQLIIGRFFETEDPEVELSVNVFFCPNRQAG